MSLNTARRDLLTEMLPEGMVVPRKWLLKNNFNRHGIDNLVKTGQLEPLATGVFKKPSSPLTWEGLVSSLQQYFSLDLVVGGLTALELQGLGHYVPMAAQNIIHVYAKEPLPKWVNNLSWVSFIQHRSKFLLKRNSKKDLEPGYDDQTFTQNWSNGKFTLYMSIPERAILEALDDVPETISFEHAGQLMQGMTAASPKKMEELLGLSKSLKAKRLFFWFAERQNYPWLAKIERNKISLGVGKRVVVKDGKLDKKYLITVPREYE